MGRVVTGAFVVFFPFPLPPLPLPFFDGFLVGFCVVTGAWVTGGVCEIILVGESSLVSSKLLAATAATAEAFSFSSGLILQ